MRFPSHTFLHTSAGPPVFWTPTTMTASCPANITAVWKTSVQMTAFSPPCPAHQTSSGHGRRHSGAAPAPHSPWWCRACRPARWPAPPPTAGTPSLKDRQRGAETSERSAGNKRVRGRTCVQREGRRVHAHPHVDHLQTHRRKTGAESAAEDRLLTALLEVI